ncbi:reverse transcriptase domain-containing protein, partial [Streptococcus anginosus]|uniref:reverse transcriptase domain-containing protein n=1 Tax=Streptococcus anginosus TaxID=1328 RepID=UPI003AF511E4
MDNVKSPTHPIQAGVPQGSVLGPILFNLYINDIPTLQLPHTTISMYADDTAIVSQSYSPLIATRRIQEQLLAIEPWLITWKIQLNVNKCQAIIYTKRPSKIR